MGSRLHRPFAAVALLAAALAPAARAETRDPRTLTLGWLTERAAVVALLTVDEATGEGPLREARARVDEVLRGAALRAGEAAVLAFQDTGHGVPWVPGARHLAFLEPGPAAADGSARWGFVSGFHGLKRVVTEGPEGRFPDLVRAYAALLDGEGLPTRREALRALLVEWMGDGDAGVRWSAATDFVRIAGLRDGMAEDERARVAAAFRAAPSGKDDKGALAVATGHAGGSDAAAALVEGLADARAREFRGDVAEGLRRLGDPGAPARLAATLEGAPPPRRADVAFVLGRSGDPAGAATARALVADAAGEVRIEAAHAVGLLARAERRRDGESRSAGRAELLSMFEQAADAWQERRAALWALVQLDDPEAFAAVRLLAESHGDPRVRAEAAQRLRFPRESLILR